MPILLALLLLLGNTLLHAQSYNFRNYNVEQGLAQSQNRVVFQDSRGYLWLGSYEGGLTKFDGYQFEIINEKSGLSNNKVQSIAEDDQGRIWVGTYRGLSIIDGKRIYNLQQEQIGVQSVQKIRKDDDGHMWVATSTAGLWRYTDTLPSRLSTMANLIVNVTLDVVSSGNQIYFVGGGSIYAFDEDDWDKGKVRVRHLFPQIKDVFVLHKIHEDLIWMGAKSGVYQLGDGELSKIPYFEGKEVRAIHSDHPEKIWVGTYDEGLVKVEGDEYKLFSERHGLVNNRVMSIIRDADGTLWVATFGGVSQFLGERFAHYREMDGLGNNLVWSLREDQEGNIWVGHNAGVSILQRDGEIRNLKNAVEFFGSKSWGIEVDEKDRIWAGSDKGLQLWDRQAFKLVYTGKEWENLLIYTLYKDSKNRIWTGGNKGLNIIDWDGPEKVYPFLYNQSIADYAVNCLFEDMAGRMWIGLEAGGLYVYDNRELVKIRSSQGMTSEIINEVKMDAEGNIWVATSLSGIFSIRMPSGSLQELEILNFDVDDGLASDNVYSLIFDDQDRLWLGTEKGIQVLEVKNAKIERINYFGFKEGFTGLEANHKAVFLANNGNIWWGTINGITRYKADSNPMDFHAPKLQLNQINLFFEEVDWKKYADRVDTHSNLPLNLKLSNKLNHLTFLYTGINLENNNEIRYQFMLENLDKDWSPPTSKREAVYSNIPPGNYTFHLKAFHRQNPEAFSSVDFSFVIDKPFWITWWFISLCALAMVGLVLLYVRIRVGILKSQRELLKRKVEERTSQVLQQNREIEEQKNEIEAQRDQLEERSVLLEHAVTELRSKNFQITSSINYAQKIQEAILPKRETISQLLNDFFIFYQPRDIVSGDFYWIAEKKGKIYLAVVDCTGHGVPGAFMSIVGSSLLQQAIMEKNLSEPAAILLDVHSGIRQALKQYQDDVELQDGMDMGLSVIDFAKKKILFAGAKRPLFVVDKEGNLEEISGDKFSLGGFQIEKDREFHTKELKWKPQTTIFMTTDGFSDQFGGKKDKKYLLSRMKKLFIELAPLSSEEISHRLSVEFHTWKADTEQTDDVLIFGVKLH